MSTTTIPEALAAVMYADHLLTSVPEHAGELDDDQRGQLKEYLAQVAKIAQDASDEL